MQTIWKYELPITDRFTLELPKDHAFLDVQSQRAGGGSEALMLWAQVDTDKPKETVHFAIVGTGHPCPDEDEGSYWYIGTAQMHGGALVWHLFYRNPWAE